jgi:large subunit ribosomal protein L13
MSNKTTFVNVKSAEKKWHFIDATDISLGKLAVKAAKLLMGKNKAFFTPNQDFSDKVVITNAEKVRITGKKLSDKMYYRHSRYAKGFKKETLSELMERDPTKAIRFAVDGMLPKNKLQDARIKNLYVYKGSEHPHQAQEGK